MSESTGSEALRYLAKAGPFIAILAAFLWWGRLRDASGATWLASALLAVTVVVVLIVILARSQASAGTEAPGHGWGGLAAVRIESLASSRMFASAAPRPGVLSAFFLSGGTVSGRLAVGDDVRFRPGPLGRWLGAEAFEISIQRLRRLAIDRRKLTVVLRDGNVIEFVVVRPQGLDAAASRLMR